VIGLMSGGESTDQGLDAANAKSFVETFIEQLNSADIEQIKTNLPEDLHDDESVETLKSIIALVAEEDGFTFKKQQSRQLTEGGIGWSSSYSCDSQYAMKGLTIISKQVGENYTVHSIAASKFAEEDSLLLISGEGMLIAFEIGTGKIFDIATNPKLVITGLVIFFVLGLIIAISICAVYIEAGQPGWAAFVPIYNLYVLAEIGEKPGWWGLMVYFGGLIPIVGGLVEFIFLIMISIGVAQTFRRGVLFGLGLAFLPFIFYPILAFSPNRF